MPVRRFVLRLYRLVRRAAAERDLSREIAWHLALHQEELRRALRVEPTFALRHE